MIGILRYGTGEKSFIAGEGACGPRMSVIQKCWESLSLWEMIGIPRFASGFQKKARDFGKISGLWNEFLQSSPLHHRRQHAIAFVLAGDGLAGFDVAVAQGSVKRV